jgi:hypothetical protein
MAEGVRVQGLAELRRELRRISTELAGELRRFNLRAAQLVRDEYRHRAPHGPHQGGGNVVPVAQSARATASQARAQVVIGGPRSPHAPPLEFGGTLRRHHSAARTTVHAQPALYPAIAATSDELVDVAAEEIDRLTRRAFPNGRL